MEHVSDSKLKSLAKKTKFHNELRFGPENIDSRRLGDRNRKIFFLKFFRNFS